jgi:nucleotide-binding universal stress UspA family protein
MMSFNTIMVQLDIDAAAEPRLEFALDLARQFESDLIAFAAAEARIIVPFGDGGTLAAEVVSQQVEEIEERLKVLEGVFQTVTADNPRASWRGHLGDPTRLLALHARSADLLIVGSPTSAMMSDHNRTVDQGALILSAGRPILLASDDLAPVRLESAVVAWKDTREARRAVADAMPFLAKAQHVLVLSIEEDEGVAARESAADVVQFLMGHGVKARSEVIDVGRSQACEALAQVACEVGANLVVSGGYGHSRVREWALGGMTRSLLRETGIHRLMSN